MAQRLDGLLVAPGKGALNTINDASVNAAVIARTLESVPAEATHWSTRSMAREMAVSQSAVLRIWHAFGMQSHRQETSKLSRDPQFVAKVRDIVGLFNRRPGRWCCTWTRRAKSRRWNRTQPILPLASGAPAARP